MGLLAVALGIGAAVAGGTAIAGAETAASNSSGDRPAQTSTQSPTGPDDSADSATESSTNQATAPSPQEPSDDVDTNAEEDDPDTASLEVDAEEASTDEEPPIRTTSSRARRPDQALRTPAVEARETSLTPPAPTPADQTTTEYGDIGKWMLQSNDDIADYGGVPHEGRTVLEAVNVIIVDPTSTNSLAATWRLNAAMRRAGFPARVIHSTGFRGLIDDIRYRQQPRGLLVGYSDDSFLVTNNHGRVFGPDPIEISSGYVWSGAFSREEWAIVNGLPRHVYVSSNQASGALAAGLVASGRGQLGGLVPLDNSYNTETITTGDHDGNAIVIILSDPYAVRAALFAEGGAPNTRTCVAIGYSPTYSAGSSCIAVAVATVT